MAQTSRSNLGTTEMANAKLWLGERRQLRTQVTKVYGLMQEFETYEPAKLKSLIAKMVDARLRLQELADLLVPTTLERDLADTQKADEQVQIGLDNEFSLIEDYKDKIREILEKLKECLAKVETQGPTNSEPVRTEENAVRSMLKVPTVPLPNYYSRDDEDITLFLMNFEDIMSKYPSSPYEKFMLLKKQIKGKAEFLLDSLEPAQHTYDEAKQELIKAFASRDCQISTLMSRLSKLRLGYKQEPYKFYSEITSIRQACIKLNVKVEEILAHEVLEAMNAKFREKIVAVTNKETPTLDEIMNNFHAAAQRYNKGGNENYQRHGSEGGARPRYNHEGGAKPKHSYEGTSKPKQGGSGGKFTSAHAADVNLVSKHKERTPKCSLCDEESHWAQECPKYSTPKAKCERLNQIGGCTKCASSFHNESKCYRTKNKKCGTCTGAHFEYLCTGGHETKKGSSGSKKTAQASLAALECLSGSSSNNTILGTLTCPVRGGPPLRVLTDSGSQSNFIAEAALTDTNHTVIERSVQLSLRGINGPKEHLTNEVEVLFEFGKKPTPVRLYVLEEIPTSLSLPKLGKVVEIFTNKGYVLADKTLHGKSTGIKNLDVLLGANVLLQLNEKLVRFGKESGYKETKHGVVLQGDIDRLISDTMHLKNLAKVDQGPTGATGTNTCTLSVVQSEQATESKDSLEDALLEYQQSEVPMEKLEEENIETEERTVESDQMLIEYLINNTERLPDGRLKMPLLFNAKVKHLLPDNYKLALTILNGLWKKFKDDPEKLKLMDNAIKELEERGIIEKVRDVQSLMEEDPTCSFLGHKPIFKPGKLSTKCRIVFLSNLCAKSRTQRTLSHNECMESGPCLNFKLSAALTQARFGKNLLCFDLKKAFCQIQLPESDQNKLLFLWFKNVCEGDNTPQAYRNTRLSFGLRPSPTILMTGLYIILIKNAPDMYPHLVDRCKEIYTKLYVDNGTTCADTSEEINKVYDSLEEIFSPYCFELQQFATNDKVLQGRLTEHEEVNNVLGVDWQTKSDTLSVKPTILDREANSKRKILATVNSVFDPLGIKLPMLNRARLFLQMLQNRPGLEWDTVISTEDLQEWRKICKQYNNANGPVLNRYVGSMTDSYELLCFCDSSGEIYGTVIYIKNRRTNELHFLLAKNRLISKTGQKRSMPALELTSILLGAETVSEVRQDLAGDACLAPVRIEDVKIYSDSLVAIHWVNSYVSMEKQNKKTPYVRNRLDKLDRVAENCPMTITHVDGIKNPADCTTRRISGALLEKSNYLTGYDRDGNTATQEAHEDILTVRLPRTEVYKKSDLVATVLTQTAVENGMKENGKSARRAAATAPSCIPYGRFSSYKKLWNVVTNVVKFGEILKAKLKAKNAERYKNITAITDPAGKAAEEIIKAAQLDAFSDALDYIRSPTKHSRAMPSILTRMNLFVDEKGLLRVGSKMMRFQGRDGFFPILLPADHAVTRLIVQRAHENRCHNGVYAVLSEIRKQFWIPKAHATVKKLLKLCVHCRRYNNRTIKLNQNSYPDFRVNASQVPFRNSFVDYIGPYNVRRNEELVKVYVLCITCIYTRAINLLYTTDLSTGELLRALQLHCFAYGMPAAIRSDLGSQFISGANITVNLLKTPEVMKYLEEKDIGTFNWIHCDKGNSSLASLVESCVKLTKRALAGSIGKLILQERDFEFFVQQARAIINKRPIAFLAGLRDSTGEVPPKEITPEMLVHGRILEWTNVVPGLQPVPEEIYQPDNTSERTTRIRDAYAKLRTCRDKLEKIYNEELVTQLIEQAVDRKDRYVKTCHNTVEVGDIVLLKEEHTKPINYPMGKVKTIKKNNIGEVVGAEILKGSSKETVKRHVTSLVPLLRRSECDQPYNPAEAKTSRAEQLQGDTKEPISTKKPQRKAANIAREKIHSQLEECNVNAHCNVVVNQMDTDTVLSTVQCAVDSPSARSGERHLRAILDTGSQMNLISEECLPHVKHEDESQVGKLTLNSVLGKNTCITKRVSLIIRVGRNERKIEAYTVPKIDIVMKLHGISKLAECIEDKGYRLADPCLKSENDIIDNVQLVLGVYMGMMPMGQRLKFGANSEITLIPEVIISGKMADLKKDIEYLSDNNLKHDVSADKKDRSVGLGPNRAKEIRNERKAAPGSKKRGMDLLLPESHRSLDHYQRLLTNVFRFVCALKRKIGKPTPPEEDFKTLTMVYAAQLEQRRHYAELFETGSQGDEKEQKLLTELNMMWHHHFDLLIPRTGRKETGCKETILGQGRCRLKANPVIPEGCQLKTLMGRASAAADQIPTVKKKQRKKWNLPWLKASMLLVCMVASYVIPTTDSSPVLEYVGTHNTKMVLDLPTQVYKYLVHTRLENSSEVQAYEMAIDEVLTNWLEFEKLKLKHDPVDNPTLGFRKAMAGPYANCSDAERCEAGERILSRNVRKKRAAPGMMNMLRINRLGRGMRRTLGRRTGVPRPKARRNMRMKKRLKTLKRVGVVGLQVAAGAASAYMIYESASDFWNYLFGPERNLDQVLTDIKENEVKEAMLEQNLSFIEGEEIDLTQDLMNYEGQRYDEIMGEMDFRSLAIFSLVKEGEQIENILQMIDKGKPLPYLKTSLRILNVISEQLDAKRCGYWVTPRMFELGGYFRLDGMDIVRRRMFLELTVPVYRVSNTTRETQAPGCQINAHSEPVVQMENLRLAETLKHLEAKQEVLGSQSGKAGVMLMQELARIRAQVVQAKQKAQEARMLAQELKLTPAWVNYLHMALFALLVIVIVICRGCFPRKWAPVASATRPSWCTLSDITNPA